MDKKDKEREPGDHAHSVEGSGWWNIPYPASFDVKLLTKQQDHIAIDGKQFVDEQGQPFLFRGLNIADPDKLVGEGQWQQSLFEEISRWGANVIRIPVHPIAWRKNGKQWYFDRLDEAVIWANKYDIYLILDWHSIGNVEDELFQHPMYQTSLAETRNFWADMALRYRDVPTMAVYELFNEPTVNYMGVANGLGDIAWDDWLEFLESNIDLIRAYDDKVIPLVAGFNWAYDLRPFAKAPVRRPNVAYAAHPYPMKAKPEVRSKANIFNAWDQVWGFMADDYPVIATEIGWVQAGGYGAHVPVIDDGSYGPMFTEYANNKGLSWCVWVFDPDWGPTMIHDWDFTPTEQGAFFKQQMQQHNQK
ncbi:cellulase family glycosylhydrolase [Neiella sp. HB171785]|uniref:Cellulase family glycosylhydrolase n=2 Tax=Neiella litorisoli TaxID=2771431 RepID=A0A8J6UPF1_9GAMM|nr:cellulase family glycosylhydrolase [Neiella litorisoli]